LNIVYGRKCKRYDSIFYSRFQFNSSNRFLCNKFIMDTSYHNKVRY
jgi:hypothetical protein